LQTGDVLELANWRVEVLPALHTVPAVGYAVAPRRQSTWWVFSGDTAVHPPFWHRINQLNVQALVIETAFSQREAALAKISRHLCPSTLNEALQLMSAGAKYPVYITHAKPAEADLILQDIRALEGARPRSEPSRCIRLLTPGQLFGWDDV
jgi:ribonuclease BN (tRNA processing enzyme)